jgi:hypothetical protein
MSVGHTGIDLKDALRGVSILAEAAAVARIFASGLARRFPFLASTLVIDLVFAVASISLPTSSVLYRRMWLVLQPFAITAICLAAWEVIALSCEGYPRAKRARRQLAIAAGVIGMTMAAAMVWSDIRGGPRWLMPWLQGMFFVRRAEAIAIAAGLLFVNLIAAIAPAPARPNSIIHARIFGAYVIAEAVGYLGMSYLRSWPVQTALPAAEIGCFIAWTVLLSRKGDEFTGIAQPSPLELAEIDRRAEKSQAEFEAALRRLSE